MEQYTPVWNSGDHNKLLSLLDALTAVRMDLTPLCGNECAVAPPADPKAAVAEACALLHSAINDLREMILRLDGMVWAVPGEVGTEVRYRPFNGTGLGRRGDWLRRP
jgi:hypothetical protein